MRILSAFDIDSSELVDTPEGSHIRRVAVAYQTASLVLVTLGVFWTVWLWFEGRFLLMTVNLAYIGAGLYLWLRIRTGRFYLAAMAVQLFLCAVIVQICLIYDIPNDAAPRVTHIYFLSLAFLSYVTFRRVNLPMTYIAVAAYLAGFVIFSSGNLALSFAEPLPDHVRVPGAWIHSIVATGIMCACVYIMQSDFSTRSDLSRQLATALADHQFELYFQPQVDHHGTVLGAEALLRWRHPRRGYVSPGEFIAAAEQIGMMRPIGKWVLEDACRQLALWQGNPTTDGLKLAVNVSPQQFRDGSFVDQVIDVVGRHRVDPKLLELELTEGIVVGDVDDIIDKMNRLAKFGVSLSLDDFGTGYSSLRYLKRMPFRQVKVDQSFIRDMLNDERDATIVKGIVQLGRELHLSIIAEGVETQEQRDFLLSLGCTEFQGYLFGQPMPADRFLEALTGEQA